MKVERWESMYMTLSFMLCNCQLYNFYKLPKNERQKILATTNTNTEHFQL